VPPRGHGGPPERAPRQRPAGRGRMWVPPSVARRPASRRAASAAASTLEIPAAAVGGRWSSITHRRTTRAPTMRTTPERVIWTVQSARCDPRNDRQIHRSRTERLGQLATSFQRDRKHVDHPAVDRPEPPTRRRRLKSPSRPADHIGFDATDPPLPFSTVCEPTGRHAKPRPARPRWGSLLGSQRSERHIASAGPRGPTRNPRRRHIAGDGPSREQSRAPRSRTRAPSGPMGGTEVRVDAERELVDGAAGSQTALPRGTAFRWLADALQWARSRNTARAIHSQSEPVTPTPGCHRST
jgi:hypothetical protein